MMLYSGENCLKEIHVLSHVILKLDDDHTPNAKIAPESVPALISLKTACSDVKITPHQKLDF